MHTPSKSTSSNALPAPGPEATRVSERLAAHIRAEIDVAGGLISFARYIALALYTPGLGYYSAGARKFGAEGDFVTAPQVSSLFGRCLARQCREVLDRIGGGELLELGAGTGLMAADILAELAALNSLPDTYHILEVSADLRERQRATLQRKVPALLDRVRWLDQPPAAGFRGVMVGNEVLDALPVYRFRVMGEEIHEACVGHEDGRFVWCYAPADETLRQAVASLAVDLGRPFSDGYQSEINLALGAWIGGLATALTQGLILLIDYGHPRAVYYHPDRHDGTLMCHYRHRAHPDPLILPGVQDITAHVDFTAVAEAGAAAGLDVAGFTTQAHFLLASGLAELLAESDPSDTVTHLKLAQEAKTLTLPDEMGERFKVIGLARGLEPPLRGFSLRNMLDRL